MTNSILKAQYYKNCLARKKKAAQEPFLRPHKDGFEGWYFKHQNEAQTVCLIVGRSLHRGKGEAFIQVMLRGQSYYVSFPLEQCHIRRSPLLIRIGDNEFSESGICMNLRADGLCLVGEVRYGTLCRLKSDIMGPLCVLKNLECRHEIDSMKHAISGKLTVNGQAIQFRPKNSCGYIEGDAGTSFPREYLWVHCNAFDQTDCSVTAAVAKIPFLRWEFTGHLCQVQLPGNSVRFASYNHSHIVHCSKDRLALQKGDWRLNIQMLDSPPPAPALKAPQMGDMARTILEQVDRTARFTLCKGRRTLLDRVSSQVCYEWVR